MTDTDLANAIASRVKSMGASFDNWAACVAAARDQGLSPEEAIAAADEASKSMGEGDG